MKVKKEVEEKILEVISDIGPNGAAITEIEKRVDIERHTLSKYLSFMQAHGLLYYKKFAAAKVWFINKAPLQTIVNSSPERRTYLENLLLSLVSHMPGGVIVIDRDFNIEFMNDAMISKYGEHYNEKFYESVLNLENPLTLKQIYGVIEGNVKKSEIEVEDKFYNFLDIKAAQLIKPDKTMSVILIINDITQSKAMEEKLKRLSSAVEQTGDIIFITNRKGLIEYVNKSFEEQTGYKESEIMGKKPNVLKSGRHTAEFYENLWKIVLSGRVFRGVLINRKKNGKLFYEKKTITPIRDSSNKITHFVSIGKDITKSIHEEQKILHNEISSKKMLENCMCGCHTLGPDGTFKDINKPELEMTGYSKSELVGKKKWENIIVPEERQLFKKHLSELKKKGRVNNFKYTIIRKDRKRIHVMLNAIAKLDSKKGIMELKGCVVRLDEK